MRARRSRARSSIGQRGVSRYGSADASSSWTAPTVSPPTIWRSAHDPVTSLASSSSLDRPGREPADDLALGDDVEDSAGTIDSVVKARTSAVSAVYCDRRSSSRPSGRVHWFAVRRTSSGSRNAFQLPTMARTATVASAGRESGSATRQKKPNVLQPSMRAASSSSKGMARKKGRRMMIVRGRREGGLRQRHAPAELSAGVSCRMRMNSGRMATAAGKSSPSTNSV